MQALVTGAGGFLGRYIVEQLIDRGDRVRAFCRGTYPHLDALGVETVQGDLRDVAAVTAACDGVDSVFHVAALAGIWGPWERYWAINTLGTRHVLGGCRRHGVGRLIYTSTPSVTFDGTDQCGIDETAPYARRWLCHYPHSKALAEAEVLRANGVDDLWTCAVRPHLIWGPHDPHLWPRLVRRAKSGRLRQIGDGANLIDVVYVENAAAAHLAACDALGPHSPVAGRAYFISQGEPVNCWEWVNRLLAVADAPPITRSVPLGLAWRAGGALELLYAGLGIDAEPPMTRFLAAQLGRSHYFDISAARRDFGYDPRISTEEGLRRLKSSVARPQGNAVTPPTPGR